MEAQGLPPLSKPKGTLTATSGSSYPIRAPPSLDSDIDENIIEDSNDNSNNSTNALMMGNKIGNSNVNNGGSSDSGDDIEEDSFLSGEDDFDTASERPFVADPDDETLELEMEDEEFETPFLGDSGEEKVRAGVVPSGSKNPGVLMPVAQVSGEDEDEGLGEGESEEDDGYSSSVRVPKVAEVDREKGVSDSLVSDEVTGKRQLGSSPLASETIDEPKTGVPEVENSTVLGPSSQKEVEPGKTEVSAIGSDEQSQFEDNEKSETSESVGLAPKATVQEVDRTGGSTTSNESNVKSDVGDNSVVEVSGLEATEQKTGDGEAEKAVGSSTVSGGVAELEKSPVVESSQPEVSQLETGVEEGRSNGVLTGGSDRKLEVEVDSKTGTVDSGEADDKTDVAEVNNEPCENPVTEAKPQVITLVSESNEMKAKNEEPSVESSVEAESKNCDAIVRGNASKTGVTLNPDAQEETIDTEPNHEKGTICPILEAINSENSNASVAEVIHKTKAVDLSLTAREGGFGDTEAEGEKSVSESKLKSSRSNEHSYSDVDEVEASEASEPLVQNMEEEIKMILLKDYINSEYQNPTLPPNTLAAETAQQIVNEMEKNSSMYLQKMDDRVVSESDEEVETDEEEQDGKEELFDSAALAALLKAASSGGTSDNTITISPSDAPRLFSSDPPAGLGSSMPSLRPTPRQNRPNIFTQAEVAALGDQDTTMDEEEKKLHEKIQNIRVKFLRLVHRLGHSSEDVVAAQVLYRLGLAEGIKRGWHGRRGVGLEAAKQEAKQLETDGGSPLDFSCTILVLGKTGVGKSATINSIFGETKARTNAFEPSTPTVREINGVLNGVKVKIIDSPGLMPSVMDQSANKKVLLSIKKFTKRCPPDIVLYVDRLDTQSRDYNDLPLLRSITSTLGASIWFNAIVALTHAACAPPDGANGAPLSYEVFVAQRSHVVQHSIRQAAGDMRLMNPVSLVENHPSCRKNREGHKVLPNGQAWRPQLLVLCYSSKILSEANALLKLQDSSPGKLFGLRIRSPPLPFLLSSLLQSRPHPKLATDQGGDNGDSDIDLDDISDSDQEGDEDEYDQLPPFKPLKKAQLAKLSKDQRKAYFEEFDYRVRLLQRRQWKEELQQIKKAKKRASAGESIVSEFPNEDYDVGPAAVPVPLPDMVLPPSFDGDNAGYRYRFLEPSSHLLSRPVLDTHGWDHDCGYDGVSLEETLAILNKFPAALSVQITKDKREFNIHLDSSVSAKHGEHGSSMAGFDIQTVGKQLAYIFRGETRFKNFYKNRTGAGFSVTILGDTIATGLKIEDRLPIGKRLNLVGSAGGVQAGSDLACGANLEVRLREGDYPIGQDQATLGLSLMRWRGDLALGANLQSQFSIGRNTKMAARVGLNNKMTGQITIRTSSSEQVQIALFGIIPLAALLFRSLWGGRESQFGR
ncbi:translocase of chloroplast 159, chloroplastic [Amborella trichopoda]|uniref:AIG1-type G domain-containing protein n=1 Tax=Amborella trichopoda TaxID=13333 RepID=W1P3S0_AMBTC|nr:translocase of chloroplast 159, chloroplastic [Amborella trichopoda]ERN02206.1 hypothetical protein AMTR_s00045p00209230 [Amborella trichopoda]|eukprot:XP_006840531.1 translocase of chloroplast 159, chloroplastic [Amborella trichopoda]